MDFKEFTTRAEQDIRAALEDASPGVGVGMNQVEKLQGESYTAITLTPEGTNIGMNLNLNQLYDRMQRGESYDSILQAAVDQAKEHLSNMPRFDVAELSHGSHTGRPYHLGVRHGIRVKLLLGNAHAVHQIIGDENRCGPIGKLLQLHAVDHGELRGGKACQYENHG